MAKFIISTDSCVDKFRSVLEKENVYYIILERITGGVVKKELYNSEKEYKDFYEEISKGALPTTSQLNLFDLETHFKNILEKEPEGDIIHVSLSSGLSETCNNARNVAAEINKNLKGRKIHILDSLSATLGMAQMVDRLISLNNQGVNALDALKNVETLRDHQQIWAIIGDLFHLKRGGRLSSFQATIGSLLKIKPILIVNTQGKLMIEKKIKGNHKAVDYVIKQLKDYGNIKEASEYSGDIYLAHSNCEQNAFTLRDAVLEVYPKANVKIGLIGPIIGTHVGEGTVALIFEGKERLDLKQ